jgi:hypothetical protein
MREWEPPLSRHVTIDPGHAGIGVCAMNVATGMSRVHTLGST